MMNDQDDEFESPDEDRHVGPLASALVMTAASLLFGAAALLAGFAMYVMQVQP